MSSVALRAGPLAVPGHVVMRSGLRWLCADGHVCRAGEVVAFCNVGVSRTAPGPEPFASEWRDLQVAFAPVVGGVFRRSADLSRGGLLDSLPWQHAWAPDLVVGTLEVADGVGGDCEVMRLLMVAGRRMTELAEVRSGLLTGWHDRTRAWWGDAAEGFGTLVCMGTCALTGIVRGEQAAFLEMFAALPGPSQVVLVQDEPLVPCARVILEQATRTPAQFAAIAEDFARGFAAGPVVPGAADWLFGGALLAGLGRNPVGESYEILTRSGMRVAGRPDALLLSLATEARDVIRHRRLGYVVNCHDFRINEAPPAILAWFRANFERVRRTPADIGRDYAALIDTLRARVDMAVLIVNAIASSGTDDIQSYAGFERPLSATLSSLRTQEMNLMLHDVAREKHVDIVDADAIAAGLGVAVHFPDRIHHSGVLQTALRGEVLHLLRQRGVAGFN